MSYKTLRFDVQDGIGFLTIHRPEALNALNREVISDLEKWLSSVSEDTSVRCVIVTGEGEKAFVAGADIKEMSDLSQDDAKKMAERGQAVMSRIETLPQPVIAAVNGFALGGGLELALACDFIVASEKAKLGLPEVSLGLIPGYGGTQRLGRHIGKSLAKMLTLTGDMYSAQQCYEWGLVAKVVTPESLLEECQRLAQTISRRGPLALKYAKKAIKEGYDLRQEEGLLREADLFGACFTTEDQKEGVKAFVEKRSPDFKGV